MRRASALNWSTSTWMVSVWISQVMIFFNYMHLELKCIACLFVSLVVCSCHPTLDSLQACPDQCSGVGNCDAVLGICECPFGRHGDGAWCFMFFSCGFRGYQDLSWQRAANLVEFTSDGASLGGKKEVTIYSQSYYFLLNLISNPIDDSSATNMCLFWIVQSILRTAKLWGCFWGGQDVHRQCLKEHNWIAVHIMHSSKKTKHWVKWLRELLPFFFMLYMIQRQYL